MSTYDGGDPTGDVAGDARGALVYDSAPLKTRLTVLGQPRFHLRTSVSAALAHWSVRLEDVAPDGRVALVTGALVNGSQRHDRLRPQPLVPHKVEGIESDLHFTSWTFQPGHRVRFSVSNAQFPMACPTPYAMTMRLFHDQTWFQLPLAGPAEAVPDLPAPEPREHATDAKDLPSQGWPYEFKVEQKRGQTRVIWQGDENLQVGSRHIRLWQRMVHDTWTERPWDSGFTAQTWQEIVLPGRTLRLEADMKIRSNQTTFHAFYHRRLRENGQLVRQRVWRQDIPRQFQ